MTTTWQRWFKVSLSQIDDDLNEECLLALISSKWVKISWSILVFAAACLSRISLIYIHLEAFSFLNDSTTQPTTLFYSTSAHQDDDRQNKKTSEIHSNAAEEKKLGETRKKISFLPSSSPFQSFLRSPYSHPPKETFFNPRILLCLPLISFSLFSHCPSHLSHSPFLFYILHYFSSSSSSSSHPFLRAHFSSWWKMVGGYGWAVEWKRSGKKCSEISIAALCSM